GRSFACAARPPHRRRAEASNRSARGQQAMTVMSRWIAYCAFFVSGAVSLVLEVLWSRQLTLVFGSTTLAVATVLATFMGGLGAGGWLASRRADRIASPLRWYGLLEGAIGIYALILPVVLTTFYPAVTRALYVWSGDRFMLLTLGRFVASALLLVVPTTLM